MQELSVKEIYDRLINIQNEMVGKTYISNEETMIYFAHLSMYKYFGGKRKIIEIINKSGILGKLPTEKARNSYINNVNQYVEQGIIFARVLKALSNTKSARKKDIVNAINKQFTASYGIKLQFDDITRTFRLGSTQYHIEPFSTAEDLAIYLVRILALEYMKEYKKIEDKYFNILFINLMGDVL